MKKPTLLLNVFLLTILFVSSILFFKAYHQDQQIINEYIVKHEIVRKNQIDKDSLYKNVISIRDTLVSEMSVDITKLGKRYLWGYSVSKILQKQSAQCGEIARILINILNKIEIPARRVTLFGHSCMHAIVEARIDGKWVIIDTNNSPKGFKEYTTYNPSSIYDHFKKKSQSKYPFIADETMRKFDLMIYSYFNLNAITYHLFNLAIFVQKPFPLYMHYLFENSPLIFCLITSLIFIIYGFVFLLVLKMKR